MKTCRGEAAATTSTPLWKSLMTLMSSMTAMVESLSPSVSNSLESLQEMNLEGKNSYRNIPVTS